MGTRWLAVAGLSRGSHDHHAVVIELGGAEPDVLADVVLPEPSFEFATERPVEIADVTADGRPDFLLRVAAADNEPGVVVSDTMTGQWRLLRNAGDDDVYFARDPSFEGGVLTTTFNDCSPNCAAGAETKVTWRYDTSADEFRST